MANIFDLAFLPVMALPFSLATYLILKTIHYCFPKIENKLPYKSPESIIEMNRLLNLREKINEIGIFLPFDGKWTIQQGFNDIWTHKGKWKYGYDFVKTENGKTYKNQGIDLDDYYAFGQPVYSPVSGHIIESIQHLSDNKINIVNNSRNWGNYLLIKCSSGFYVKIAHLKNNSIIVPINSFVEAGQKIAECGNSGYSQEPHIHVQVQNSPFENAETLPFNLLNFVNQTDQFTYFKHSAKKNEEISPLIFNYSLFNILNFKLGDQLKFKEINIKSSDSREHIITVMIDPLLGKLYLNDGKSKLYFSHCGSRFYFYNLEGSQESILWDLLIAAPSIPISFGTIFKYQEFLPLKIISTKLSKTIHFLCSSFYNKKKSHNASYEFHPQDLFVRGEVLIKKKIITTFLNLDLFLGIKSFGTKTKSYERV